MRGPEPPPGEAMASVRRDVCCLRFVPWVKSPVKSWSKRRYHAEVSWASKETKQVRRMGTPLLPFLESRQEAPDEGRRTEGRRVHRDTLVFFQPLVATDLAQSHLRALRLLTSSPTGAMHVYTACLYRVATCAAAP